MTQPARMIFVNLPVRDLPTARAFYEALGFTNEPRFTDDTAAAMVWSETIVVMLLTHAKWATFTSKPLPQDGSCGVMLCLSCVDRGEVDRLAGAAGPAGGITDANAPEDHGFMFSRSLADPDGHVWEVMWMDPAVAEGAGPTAMAV